MITKLRSFLKDSKENPSPNLNSTEFEINTWAISKIVLKNIIPVVGVHPFPLTELMLMTGSIARLKPDYIFEWGTNIGKSARVFYEAAKALGLKTTIHSIDLPDEVEHNEHPHRDRGKLVRSLSNVKLHQGDGLETSFKILASLNGDAQKGKGSLFFVDGDHSYDSVKCELTGIMDKAPLASVLLHDTFFQSQDSNYNIGPHKAINECLNSNPHRYKRIDVAIGLPGMTLLFPFEKL